MLAFYSMSKEDESVVVCQGHRQVTRGLQVQLLGESLGKSLVASGLLGELLRE